MTKSLWVDVWSADLAEMSATGVDSVMCQDKCSSGWLLVVRWWRTAFVRTMPSTSTKITTATWVSTDRQIHRQPRLSTSSGETTAKQTHTDSQLFDGPLSGTTRVSRYQAAKTINIFRWNYSKVNRVATVLNSMGTHMSYGITQCYLPPDSGDIPTFTGTWFSNAGGMQDWVDLVGWLYTEMVYMYPHEDSHPIPVLTGLDIG